MTGARSRDGGAGVVRVAAVGDVHVGPTSAGRLRRELAGIADHADLLLLAGDLTERGLPEEGRLLAQELDALPVPVAAVLGNHDYESGGHDELRAMLEDVGVRVLEGEGTVLTLGRTSVGVAGVKGFGGGFVGASGSEFGEPEMKAFMRHTALVAARLEEALVAVAHAAVRIALLHYAPVEATLEGERLEIYPFLGSHLLADAVDRGGAHLAVHGHAHAGAERGVTPGGVPVGNVARPVLRRPYALFRLDAATGAEVPAGAPAGGEAPAAPAGLSRR